MDVGGRLLDCSNDGLGILEVDVPGDREAEQAALLLAMDHRDHARAVRLFNGPDRWARRGVPSAHEQGLQGDHKKRIHSSDEKSSAMLAVP